MVTTSTREIGTPQVKRGMAQMLRGGVIMDIVTPKRTKVTGDADAVTVMVLGRMSVDIHAQGGAAHASDPGLVEDIVGTVSTPTMAKTYISHSVEAQALESLGADYTDEPEVLTPANYTHHIDKWNSTVPSVCGATDLGEALHRVNESVAVIRPKGETGTGGVPNAATHMRRVRDEIRHLTNLPEDELYVATRELQTLYEFIIEVAREKRLSIVLFTIGDIATPADATMMMQLDAEDVFMGPDVLKSGDSAKRAAAIVRTTIFHDDPKVITEVSRDLGEAMVGINADDIPVSHRLTGHGW